MALLKLLPFFCSRSLRALHKTGPQQLRPERTTHMRIELIRHNGFPFVPNEHARLIATGIKHHIVLIL